MRCEEQGQGLEKPLKKMKRRGKRKVNDETL
jgi:hypothetical protein